MKKIFTIALIALFCVSFAPVAHAATPGEWFESQIASILSQIERLQQQLNEMIGGQTAAVGGAVPPAPANFTSGLANQWTMDLMGGINGNSVIDVVGGKNGTMSLITSGFGAQDTVFAQSPLPIVVGLIGSSTVFDGVSRFINLGKTTLGGGATMSIGAWIKPELVTGVRTIFQRREDVGSPLRRDFIFRIVNGALGLYVNGGYNWATAANAIPANSWHHVMATFDGRAGSASVKLYVDGVLKPLASQSAIPGVINANSLTTLIGATCAAQGNNGCPYHPASGATNEMFKGAIDDLRIYNRTLTGADVLALYNSATTVAPVCTVGAVDASGACAISWTLPNTTSEINRVRWSSIIYGAGLFVAVSQDDYIMTSPDGVAWTIRNGAGNKKIGDQDSVGGWANIAYGAGRFVAVGYPNRVAVSSDGINWSIGFGLGGSGGGNAFAAGNSAAWRAWSGIVYANGQFVVVDASNHAMSSPDGVTWTPKDSVNFLTNYGGWNGIAYGNNTYVAVGSFNQVATSPDGLTWTPRASGIINDGALRGVAYGSGLFVAVGSNNRMITSPDGITWTQRTNDNDRYRWEGVTYGNGRFVAIGIGNGRAIISSVDGITWSPAIDIGSGAGYGKSIAYGNGRFVSVSNGDVGKRVLVGVAVATASGCVPGEVVDSRIYSAWSPITCPALTSGLPYTSQTRTYTYKNRSTTCVDTTVAVPVTESRVCLPPGAGEGPVYDFTATASNITVNKIAGNTSDPYPMNLVLSTQLISGATATLFEVGKLEINTSGSWATISASLAASLFSYTTFGSCSGSITVGSAACQMNWTVNPNAQSGTYQFRFPVISGGITRYATFTLTVVAPQGPTISSISPVQASVSDNTVFTIFGTNLLGITTVNFYKLGQLSGSISSLDSVATGSIVFHGGLFQANSSEGEYLVGVGSSNKVNLKFLAPTCTIGAVASPESCSTSFAPVTCPANGQRSRVCTQHLYTTNCAIADSAVTRHESCAYVPPAPTISVSNTAPAIQWVVSGTQGFKHLNIILDAAGSGEDVKFASFKASLLASSPSDLSGCAIWDGATQISDTLFVSENGVQTFVVTSGKYTVPKNLVKTLDLKCNISGTSGNTIVWHIFNDQSGVGATSGQPVSINYGTRVAGVAVLTDRGTFTVLKHSASPSYRMVAAGMEKVASDMSNVTVGVLALRATTEPIELQKLAIQLTAGSYTDITRVALFDPMTDTEVGHTVLGGSTGHITITPGSFIIPKDSDRLLYIMVDLSNITSSGAVNESGHLIKVDYDGNAGANTQGRGVNSGAAYNPTSVDTQFEGVRVMKSYPTVTLLSVPTNSLVGDGTHKILRFKVTATSGPVTLGQFSFSAFATTVQLSNLNAYAFSNPGFYEAFPGTLTNGKLMSSGISNGNVNKIKPTTPLLIPAGGTAYVEVRADVSGVPSGYGTIASIRTNLVADYSWAMGNLNTMTASSGFVWSPNSIGISTASSNDWFNGAGGTALTIPEDSVTLSKN